MGSCFTEHSRNKSFRYNSENYYCLQCKEEKQVTLFWFSVWFASKTTVFVVGAKGKRGEKKSAAVRGEVWGRRRRSLGFVKQARDGEEESDRRRREMWINKWKQLHEEEKLQTQNLLGEGEEEEEEHYYGTVEELINVCEEVVSLEPWARMKCGFLFILVQFFIIIKFGCFIFCSTI